MTIEEAIKDLEQFLDSPIGDGDLHMESVETALSTLREKAERSKGCEYCNNPAFNYAEAYTYCPHCGRALKGGE